MQNNEEKSLNREILESLIAFLKDQWWLVAGIAALAASFCF